MAARRPSAPTGFAHTRSNQGDRHGRSRRGWPSAQQSSGEFASTVSTAREGDAAVSEHEDPAEIQFNSRAGPQSFQSGAPPRQQRNIQRKTVGFADGVARSRVINATLVGRAAPDRARRSLP